MSIPETLSKPCTPMAVFAIPIPMNGFPNIFDLSMAVAPNCPVICTPFSLMSSGVKPSESASSLKLAL
ncbi:MAG: hypothetical protein UH625_01085 [Muribaculaceae bacterium]|nr:hypothetical protein [Muribaculaceae bacterium]